MQIPLRFEKTDFHSVINQKEKGFRRFCPIRKNITGSDWLRDMSFLRKDQKRIEPHIRSQIYFFKLIIFWVTEILSLIWHLIRTSFASCICCLFKVYN
jgi:hypothetical protein